MPYNPLFIVYVYVYEDVRNVNWRNIEVQFLIDISILHSIPYSVIRGNILGGVLNLAMANTVCQVPAFGAANTTSVRHVISVDNINTR